MAQAACQGCYSQHRMAARVALVADYTHEVVSAHLLAVTLKACMVAVLDLKGKQVRLRVGFFFG